MTDRREPEAFDLLRCIGCGAIEAGPACLGTCIDRRLDLVPAAAHEDARAALAATRAAGAEARAFVRALAAAETGDAQRAYRELQAQARVLPQLHRPPAVEPVTAWSCGSCGRIEAPQPCIGVCIRNPVRMVAAGAYAEVMAALDEAAAAAAPALALARRLAWSTPRPGQWERGLHALRAQAADLLGR